jgi:hypothetical protein
MGIDTLSIAQVERVEYERWRKLGKNDSVKVTYHCRLDGRHAAVAEWVCLEHPNGAAARAATWVTRRGGTARTIDAALAESDSWRVPAELILDVSGQWPRVVSTRGWKDG